MKKLLLGTVLILMFNCSSTKKTNSHNTENAPITYDFTGKLNQTDIDFLKNAYTWDNGDILVINFKQPQSACHYDAYVNPQSGQNWWNKFYTKIDLTNCSNIFVYSDSNRMKTIIDNKNYFADKENFLLNNYFKKKNSCYGLLVINEKGEYLQHNGEYTESQVSKYIANLKKTNAE